MLQLTQLFSGGSGQNAIIICSQLPDDSCVLDLQRLVDDTHANLAVAILRPDILASAHETTIAEAVALVSEGMPAVDAVAMPQYSSKADSMPEEQSMPSMAGAAAPLEIATELKSADSAGKGHSMQSMASGAAAFKSNMVQLVTTAAQQAMGSSQAVSVSEPLMDAGLDSSTSIQLVSLLEEATGLELPGTLAFDYPTVAEIATYLTTLQQPALSYPTATCPTLQQPAPPLPAQASEQASEQASSIVLVQSQTKGAPLPSDGPVSASEGIKLSLNQLTNLVMMTAKDVLGLSSDSGQLQQPLSPDSPLMDAGLDSSLAIQFTSQLETTLHVDLPGTLVFDYPSVDDIVTFLAASLCHDEPHMGAIDADSPVPLVSDATAFQTVATAVDTANVLQSVVVHHIADITGNSDIDTSTPLMDAGVTSATAIELTSALEEALSCELPGTLIFDYPTVASLVAFLSSCSITLPTDGIPADTAVHSATPVQPAHTPPIISTASASGVDERGSQAVTVHMPRAVAAGAAQFSPPAIALVATAHRVPGGSLVSLNASSASADRVSTVPLDRWHVSEASPGNAAELNHQFGAFLSGADEFDPTAFHLSTAEATLMDPQQRLLLECFAEAWTSHDINSIPQQPHPASVDVPQAAVHGSNSKQNVGVYVGVSQLEYARITYETGINLNAYYATGAHLSVTAGRIAYTFGLKGPAMAVDTACSSSLVTTHLAARALRGGEVGAAASMGVNLTLVHSWTRACLRAGMLSEDGRYCIL